MNETNSAALRRKIKEKARLSLKKHYWIFVAAALAAAVLGTEYSNTMEIFQLQKNGISEEAEAVTNISTSLGVNGGNEGSLINDLINGNWKGTTEAVQHRLEVLQGEETYVGDVQLGHSRGVFASFINEFESGALLLSLLTLIDTITGSPKLAVILLALLGFTVLILFWLYATNVYRAILSRVFLEGRIYQKIPVSRFMYLYRIKKHTRAALSMALYTLLKYLWLLTIVMYPVKRYAYLMVPYLVAENPDLSGREALKLSSQMMKGHKWEAFVLDLSMLPWLLLTIVTGGLAGLFYYNPYREAVLAEYCAYIRSLAIDGKMEGTELLNDRYLYELPDEAALNEAYQDIIRIAEEEQKEIPARGGVWGWLESWFGVVPYLDEKEKEFRAHMHSTMIKEEYLDALDGKTYPTRLYPIKETEKRKKAEDLGYMRHYPVCAVILLFFIFCMFGWFWEVALHLLQAGEFVNRGVLHGPWLPIYGNGAILILLLLYRLRKKPFAEFTAIIIVCGVIEYMTSLILEFLHGGAKWWDYTGYYLNLNGRICAEGLLVFGVGGMAFIYVLAPMLDNLIEQIQLKILVPLCTVLLLVYCVDTVYSTIHPNTGEGITSVTDKKVPGQN